MPIEECAEWPVRCESVSWPLVRGDECGAFDSMLLGEAGPHDHMEPSVGQAAIAVMSLVGALSANSESHTVTLH